ncbi:MAG: cysteine peptidase family C39 domain-containing protein [Blastocatellia bacterium]
MLPLFAQELSTSCVAACLRMALAALGFSITEAEIRSRCGHSGLGMRLNQVAQGLADLPIKVECHTDWSIDDLTDAVRRSVFPIVGIDLRFVDGLFAFHAVVIADVMSGHVVAHDPRNSQSPRSISLQTFEDAWESADRECLVIEMKQRV